jgi:ribose transport system substrate-binding protein
MSQTVFSTLLAASLLSLVSCGGSQHAATEKYYLVATNVKVPYWQQAAAGLTRAAAQFQVQAEFVGPDSYDPKAQHAQFLAVLGKKPTGILVSVSDPAVLQADIDNAIAQGIPVITVDSDAPGSKRLTFIGTDNYKAGVMGAKIVADKLQGKGSVVVFTIEGQGNLQDRLRGYKDGLEGHPGIKLAQIVNMQGDPRIAFDTTKELLEKKTKVDAFVCLEAIACPEVADVLERQKAAGVVVVAMDTDQRTLEAIRKGLITATIGQKPFSMAFLGLKLLDDLHHYPVTPLGKNWSQDSFSPVPTFVDTGATLIDKSNVDQFVEARNSATAK